MSAPFEAARAACGFLQDGSALLPWGGFAYLAAIVPASLGGSTDRKLHALRLVSIAIALIATAAMLPLRAADVGGSGLDAFDQVTLRALLFDTRVGHAWQCQAAAAPDLRAEAATALRWSRLHSGSAP